MARIEIPYKPRDAFQPLHQSNRRWAVVVAHRRAGKTVACVNQLIKEALTTRRKDFRGAYIAPFYKQSKSVAWDYFKQFTRVISGIVINESELRIDFKNGARIQLFGADNADSLRGLYFDSIICDEYGDWKSTVFQYVVRPALADRQGKAVIIGTPKGRNQFWEVYDRACHSDDWLALKITVDESGILPQSEVNALKNELSEDAWRQEMECDFDAALPGAIWGRELYQAEQDGRITGVEYDGFADVYTAWDLGYSDDTAIWFYQVIHGEVHFIDFYAASGKSIEHYAAQVLSRPYRYKTHFLPHDARAKTLASGGKSVIEMLAEHLSITKMAITPSLSMQDGIQAVRMMMPRAWFDKERCYDGIEALKQYQREWDEDKKMFRDKPRHDWTSHAADSMRYAAINWKEEVKPVVEDKPIRGIMVGQTDVTLNELWASQPKQKTKRI
jgi:phage terminase large subunit